MSWVPALVGGSTSWVPALVGGSTSWVQALVGGSTSWVQALVGASTQRFTLGRAALPRSGLRAPRSVLQPSDRSTAWEHLTPWSDWGHNFARGFGKAGRSHRLQLTARRCGFAITQAAPAFSSYSRVHWTVAGEPSEAEFVGRERGVDTSLGSGYRRRLVMHCPLRPPLNIRRAFRTCWSHPARLPSSPALPQSLGLESFMPPSLLPHIVHFAEGITTHWLARGATLGFMPPLLARPPALGREVSGQPPPASNVPCYFRSSRPA